MPKLYGVARSRASRPLWLLYETGAPFERVPVIQSYRLPDAAAPDAPLHTASPAYLAINPQGQVPAWEEDGLILTESLAICLHIARTRGGHAGPMTPAEVSQAENWALFAATSIEPDALAIMSAVNAGQAETDTGRGAIERSVTGLARSLRRLEALLGGQDWLMDARFTVADVMVAECLRYGTAHAPLLAPWPAVAAWLARCQSRPAYRRMWEERMAEPA